MNVSFQIFHESDNPRNAESAVRHMMNKTSVNCKILSTEPYLDKGCVSNCEAMVNSGSTWEETVFNTIKLAQSFGLHWRLCGDVAEEISLITDTFRNGNGITFSKVEFSKEFAAEAQKLVAISLEGSVG